jgi:predicted TIM-barrel fold metal-dependent hydrolase
MPDRADAHIHLFEHGYRGSFTARPGVKIDEPALYESLAKDHGVKAALVVGYEGEKWAEGNNAFLATMVARHAWVRPVAFVDPTKPPSVDALEHFRVEKFVGLSFYIYDDAGVKAVQAMDDHVWAWLAAHKWLISLNSRGPFIRGWEPIINRHPELRLILSHLGLPPKVREAPKPDEARRAMSDILALAQHRHAHVKLSGFYAVTDPGHDYPHRAAWPYVQALVEAFGVDRLHWGSDFVPCLDHLTYPQTLDMFGKIPFFSDADRMKVQGATLLSLLREIEA